MDPTSPDFDLHTSKMIALVGMILVVLLVMYGYYLDFRKRKKK